MLTRHTPVQVKFVKVNVDEVGEVSSAEGIRAMPTFKLYNDGRVETVQVCAEVACDPVRVLSLPFSNA